MGERVHQAGALLLLCDFEREVAAGGAQKAQRRSASQHLIMRLASGVSSQTREGYPWFLLFSPSAPLGETFGYFLISVQNKG